MSEAWSTAWVGWCLASCPPPLRSEARTCLQRALRALSGCRCAGGWGYNRTTGPDADSTAWVVRFLSHLGASVGPSVAGLESFLDVHGRAHTFLESDAGAWGDAHPDVTALVGLALLAAPASRSTIARVREAVLCAREPGAGWNSFWWTTNTYATYWSAAFLRRSGGLPVQVASELQQWLHYTSDLTSSAFELSHRLLLATALGLSGGPLAEMLVDCLLELFEANEGWPPSAHLLVPSNSDDAALEHKGFPDSQRLVTTAIATRALTNWAMEDG